jgi:CHAT domain
MTQRSPNPIPIFQAAMAKLGRTLISHWPVDARATSSFMQVLGQHKGENAARAFSAAARALRNQSRIAHPAFWAPFDLVGRGRELAPIDISESPSHSPSP